MKQVIDMGGFKNQEIEVVFAGETYNIQLDPPIEVYRRVIAYQQGKKKVDSNESIDELKDLIATIICKKREQSGEEFIKSKNDFIKILTLPACFRFINAYTDLLYKGSGLKNSSSPPSQSETKLETKEELEGKEEKK